MSQAIEILQKALSQAMASRPKVGGFPVLAEMLRKAGVTKNIWTLPACQSLYLTNAGPVVSVGTPLASGMADVPHFDREALVRALRADQVGQTSFPEFLSAAWRAGVVRYEVDFEERNVIYYGCQGEAHIESYPAVTA